MVCNRAEENRENKVRLVPTYLFRRASVDQMTFSKPTPSTQPPTNGFTPRSSALNLSNQPRHLSSIFEAPQSDPEDTRRLPALIVGEIAALHEISQQNGNHGRSSISLPLANVPDRRSSRTRLRRKTSLDSRISAELRPAPFAPSEGLEHTITMRGQSTSPVRFATAKLNAISSDLQRGPSKTFIRPVKPTDMLVVPELDHHRVGLHMQVAAPLFMGGGTIEGQAFVSIDKGKQQGGRKARQAITIAKISVDVLGVEACFGKQFIFRSLATELIDESHAPPNTMRAVSGGVSGGFWEITPSISVLPFRLNLPVNMGPPPYSSKAASIRYILCITLVFKVSEKQCYVRKSQEIAVLTVHDPEKALVNLPSPLTANDELHLSPSQSRESIKLTAGVHRQTWVSGTTLFLDVHISNSTLKIVKKIELQIERAMTFYHHAAASTMTEAGDHLRLPDRAEKEILARRSTKRARHGWRGILPQSQDVRTCCIDVPLSLVTIDTGRFFGVRFFVNVLITCSSKTLAVQLPITIIHPNSLDIVPNSLAQVASAVDHYHQHHRQRSSLTAQSNTPYRYNQGTAFTAARRQSVEQLHDTSAKIPVREIDELTRTLERSPRKSLQREFVDGAGDRGAFRKHSTATLRKENHQPKKRVSSFWGGMSSRPRLQKSTSGLRFNTSTSEGDVDSLREDERTKERTVDEGDSGWTVYHDGMVEQRDLSLKEREAIRLQRELNHARKRSKELGSGWRNIASEEAEKE